MYTIFKLSLILLTTHSLLYTAADTTETFRICGVSNEEIGYCERIFKFYSYPKENPFIVFGQKTMSFAQPPTIQTALSCRSFVAGLILLHAKSSDFKNLAFVHNHFLDGFTDAQLLKGRVGNDNELNGLIAEYLQRFIQKYHTNDIIDYNPSDEPSDEISLYTKNFRKKDFIRCKLSWLSLFGQSELKLKQYKFKLPLKTSLSPRVDFKQVTSPDMTISVYGLSKECKNKLNKPHFQKKISSNREHYPPISAALEYALDINTGFKSFYAQPSFFMLFNLPTMFNYNDNACDRIKEVEEELLDSTFSRFIIHDSDNDKTEEKSYIDTYSNIEAQGDKQLTAKDILFMLRDLL